MTGCHVLIETDSSTQCAFWNQRCMHTESSLIKGKYESCRPVSNDRNEGSNKTKNIFKYYNADGH